MAPSTPPKASTTTTDDPRSNNAGTSPATPSDPPERGAPRSPFIAGLNFLDRVIERIEKLLLAYGILIMAANTIANVVGRQVFGRSLYFSQELNEFLIVLVTFVGMGYAARKGRHIRMSAFYDLLSERLKKALMIFICLATGAVMFTMAYFSLMYVMSVAASGRVTPSLRVPIYLTYLWVPLGFTITGIQYWLAVVANLREKETYISYSEPDVYHDVGEEFVELAKHKQNQEARG